MKLKRMAIATTFAILLSGCGNDSNEPSSNGNDKLFTQLNITDSATKIHFKSLKYPLINIPDIQLSQNETILVTDLVGQDNDLYSLTFSNDDGSKNYGSLVLTKSEIINNKINLNPLSHFISRNILQDYLTLTDEEILSFRDELAKKLFKSDINNDGVIDFNDVLKFDPKKTSDIDALTFDYQAYLLKVNNEVNSNLYAAFKNNDTDSIATIEDQFFPDYIELDNKYISDEVHISDISTGIGGEITSDNTKLNSLNEKNSKVIIVNKAPDKKLLLTATASNGYSFKEWIGCQNITSDNQCEVDLYQDNRIVATFKKGLQSTAPNWNTTTCEKAAIDNGELPAACYKLDEKYYKKPDNLDLGRAVFSFGTDGCFASAPVYSKNGVLMQNPGLALKDGATSNCNYYNQLDKAYLTYNEITSTTNSDYKARIFGFYAVKDECAKYTPKCGHINEWEHVIVWMHNNRPEYVTHTIHNFFETKSADKATHLKDAPNTFVFKYIQEAGVSSHYPDFAGSNSKGEYISDFPTPSGVLFGSLDNQVIDYANASSEFKAIIKSDWPRVTQRVDDKKWLNSTVCMNRLNVCPLGIGKKKIIPWSNISF